VIRLCSLNGDTAHFDISQAADFAKFNTKFEILGGYLSPVSDSYKKAGLASSVHRYVFLGL
jgi:hypothetical protein